MKLAFPGALAHVSFVMKNTVLFSLLLVLAVVGCSKKEAKPTASATNENYSSGNPVTAPVDYLGAIAKAKKSSEKTIDTVALNQAVQQFNVTEGRYPKDLNELVTEKYMPRLPEPPYGMKIVYEASTGTVKVVPK
ncbi:MAG: hypothetical protein DME18_01450 [Verrucomicrobia bacterium]|nr:MAG: hypothetical protein DME19_10765 [Verrucomicrobiota bacterium]PYM16431.1 MAG: hypothetical protein DME18_01450 [Verrucomicrobiota bacterium]